MSRGQQSSQQCNKNLLQKKMQTVSTSSTAGLNDKLNFSIKLTVKEKLLLLSTIRDNINKQLDFGETFHGEHYSTASFENVGYLMRIERALTLTHPKDEVRADKKFDLFN